MSRINFFDLALRLQGFDIAFAKAELQRLHELSDADFEAYQARQRSAILDHHLQQNRFYQRLAGSNRRWEDLPVLTKADLQIPLSQRLSNGFSLKQVHQHKTSGSGGHPFVFAKDKLTHALSWASFYHYYEQQGIDLSGSLEARFYGIPLDFLGYRKERLKDWLSARYRFPVFDLSKRQLERIQTQFEKRPFAYINGYTSSILLFARHLLEQDLVLTKLCPTLQCCIVTSEVLFDDDRITLEKALGVPVINEYGASEIGLIAMDTPEHLLLIDSPLIYLEILDEDDQPLPEGETGRIVITSLYNKAHPFIRYDIGDTGALSSTSNQRKVQLERLEGRTNDIAHLPSGKTVPGLTFYYVTKKVMEASGNVKEFVVQQTHPHRFHMKYVADRALTSNEKEHVAQAVEQYLEPGLELVFERLTHSDRSRRGKLKQFTTLVGKAPSDEA
ncbi:phenylacetate--CoA ligase family protein [Croceiramulus getboli]|nr:phenylacetate--CoA ligase family protein [Flavobacteriaceae bacterium YJPT1-3]